LFLVLDDSESFIGPIRDNNTGRRTMPLKSPKIAVKVKTLKSVRNA